MTYDAGGLTGALARSHSDGGSLPGWTTARRVIALIRPWRRPFAFGLAISTLNSVLDIAIVVATARLIDTLGDAGRWSETVVLAGGLAAAGIGLTLTSMAVRWCSATLTEGVVRELRVRAFDHLQRMPLQFLGATRTGAVVSRLNNDINGARQAFVSLLAGGVSNALAVALAIPVMIGLSWRLTALAVLLVPAFVLPARRIGRSLAELSRELSRHNASLVSTMTERLGVAGATLVKLFGVPHNEARAFDTQARAISDVGVRTVMYGRLYFGFLGLMALLAQALTYGLGGRLILTGATSPAVVVTFALLLTRLYTPLTNLSGVRLDVTTAMVSFQRVFEILDLDSTLTESPHATAIPAGPATVEFVDVHFSYPEPGVPPSLAPDASPVACQLPRKEVLRGVSLTIRPRQVVALVGASGAGKTTAATLIPRLYDVTSGSVRINGLDVRDASFASIRETVGVVSQEAHLFHDTIRANLCYAKPDAPDAELWDALERAYLAATVGALPDGLDTVVGDWGHRFSGGERQRLAIARLLLKEPRVVILDEATAHLDTRSESTVQRALVDALAGRTALVIAHRLSTIRGADRILVLDAGRVVEDGRHDELLARNGRYAQLYLHQHLDQHLHQRRLPTPVDPTPARNGGRRQEGSR